MKPFIWNEKQRYGVSNRLVDEDGMIFRESAVSSLDFSNVRVMFPLIDAMHADRLTLNNTLYEEKELIGNSDQLDPRGYMSFVKPFGRPIVREHRLSDDWFQADDPMGRIYISGYQRRPKSGTQTPMPKGYPGTYEGRGTMRQVFAVTDPAAIERLWTGAYHTVSIQVRADKVVESISGVDLLEAYRRGEEPPPYVRGTMYLDEKTGEERLSYWILRGLKGKETSFVNNPADELATVVAKDIGSDGIRILLGDKKVGEKAFDMYDPRTGELVTAFADSEYLARDESFTVSDSLIVSDRYTFVPRPSRVEPVKSTESFVAETLAKFLRK